MQREGIVFDLETIRHPELDRWLGTAEKISRLDGVSDDALKRIAEAYDIKLGQMKDPVKIKAKIADVYRKESEKAAVQMYGCSICTIATKPVYEVEEDLILVRAGKDIATAANYTAPTVWNVEGDHTEKDVLDAFCRYIAANPDSVLMGFNIRGTGVWKKGFDIPILRVRCAILGVPWPSHLPKTMFEDRRHRSLFDICDVFGEGRLDHWLRMCGLPPKTDSGAAVQDMTPAERALYCCNDVELERLLCGVVLTTQASEYSDLLN